MCHLTENFLLIQTKNDKSELIQLSNLQYIQLKNDQLILQVKRTNTELTVRMSNKNEKILLEWDKILKNFFLTISSNKIKRENMRKKVILELIKTTNEKNPKSFGKKEIMNLQKSSDLTYIEIKKNLKKDNYIENQIKTENNPLDFERKSWDLITQKENNSTRSSENLHEKRKPFHHAHSNKEISLNIKKINVDDYDSNLSIKKTPHTMRIESNFLEFTPESTKIEKQIYIPVKTEEIVECNSYQSRKK